MQDFPPYRQIFAPHFPAQVRNAILGVVAVALTILLLDGWRSINSYQSTLRESSENLNDLSRLIAEQTESTFELADSLLASNVAIMELGPLEANTKAGIHLSLLAVVKDSPRIAAISVFDAQCIYLNGSFTNTDTGKLNCADREYFAHHRDHPDKILYIGQPIQRKSTQEWAISMSRRWNKPDASFGGGIVSAVNLTYFQDFFKTVNIGSRGSLALYRDDGVTLVRHSPRGGTAEQLKTVEVSFSKDLLQGSQGLFRAKSRYDGEERLYSYRHLKRYPVIVVAAYSVNDMMEPWRADALRHLAVAISLIIILTILGARLVRQMKQRLEDLITLQQGQAKIEKLNRELNLRTAQAEAASLFKSQFLANMSHEIRTPMNAMLGMLQLLEHTRLNAKQQDYLNKVQTATNTLLSIINDILDFSKVEAGKMTLDLHPFRLDHLLRDLGVILSASIGNKSIEVLFDIDPDLPTYVYGDSLRLRQTLLNLSGNAIKFTEHGEVVLTVRLHRKDVDKDGDNDVDKDGDDRTCAIAFEVKDSGIGITKDQLNHIFSGFSQAEASTTRRFGGTGLGLAISQSLVQLMNGKLQVESEPGKGSRFYFSIRFNLPDAAMPSMLSASTQVAAPTAQPWSRILHTLVVDDNQLARESLCSMASSLGWTVDSASSGPEALNRLQESAAAGTPYELILIDWLMPEMDGWETARQIRKQSQHDCLPIVVMVTAHARALLEERNKQDAMALDGFLFKPVTTAALCDALGAIDIGRDGVGDVMSPVRHQRLVGVRLLVVEDNPLNQQVAQELLANEGALVMLADNGQIALDILTGSQHNFDLVLMDIQMPVMDGYTATRLLREHTSLAGLPIIAMTANALASDYDDCIRAGMNDHIGKPFVITQLVEVIRRYLRQLPVIMPELTQAHAARTPELPLPSAILQMAAQHELELAFALSNLNYNLPLLRTGLQLFYKDAGHLSQHIPVLFDTRNLDELALVLHTLKTSAAIIGARRLSHQVTILENKLKNSQLITVLENDFNQLVQQLAQKSAILGSIIEAWDQAVLVIPSEPTESAASQGLNRADLSSLIKSLQASNMVALDQHQKLQASLLVFSPDLAQQLQQEIDHFDFSNAAQTCQRLLTLLDGASHA